WKIVGRSDDGTVVQVDVANIKTREKRLTAWVTYSYGSPEKLDTGELYKSTVSLEVFDCESERLGTAAMNFYSEPFGGGKVLYTEDTPLMLVKMGYVRPGTLGYATLSAVCSTVS